MKIKTSVFVTVLLLIQFSCKKEDLQGNRLKSNNEKFPIYQGYPSWEEDCTECEAALRAVSYNAGILHFTDYEHFFEVRNCLAVAHDRANDVFYDQWSRLTEQELEDKENLVQYDYEMTLNSFELQYPGYKSLRKAANKLEIDWMDAGGDPNSLPDYPVISDPVEMALVSGTGKVGFGNDVFDIYDETNQLKSSCKNLASNQTLYSAGGNYYFLGRNSVFPWPWGTTVYSTTKSYKKKSSGGLKLIAKKIGLKGGGNMYNTSNCDLKKGFFVEEVTKTKKEITRSYTEWGGGSLQKNSYASYHFYESLISPGLPLWK